ncbi:MAG: hypothetical protein AAGA74_12330 [Pseudomonadota bacterium]
MAERVEITDEETAQRWLETQDHQTRVLFASRCALRALPTLGKSWDATTSRLEFTGCRAMLISLAAGTCPAAEMMALDKSAKSAASASADSDSAAHSAHSVTFDADSADIAAHSVADSAAAAWAASSFDASVLSSGKTIQLGALWPDGQQPESLQLAWTALKAQWEADAADWSFWIEWYEAMLNGEWTNWDLIFRIAKDISEEDWDAGPERVAQRIGEIKQEFLVEVLPQVNEIFETEDGLYEVRGSIADTSKLMNSVLTRVSFALDTAVQSNRCDLNEMALPCKILRQALATGEDDANTVEQYLRRASSLFKAGIISGKFAEDDETRFLTDLLDETALQLRGDHPEVAQATQTRLSQRLCEIDGETRIKTAILIDNLRDGTAQRLNAELKLAAEVARDVSSVEATADAIKESGNTAGKISVLERAKRAESSGPMAVTKMGLRAQGLVDLVIRLISGGG